MWPEIATAAVALVVLVSVVGLRSLSAGRIEVRLPDAIIATIAAALMLLMTGRINKLIVGTEGITVETAREAILSASKQSVTPQVSPLPVAQVEQALKGGIAEIPDLVRRQVQALEFVFGAGSYNAAAMQQYLETLSKYSFFRFVVFFNSDMTLFGMMDARKLLATLENPGTGQNFASLAALVNSGTADDKAQLAKLPGFVPASAAVKPDTNKRDVLQQMETKNVDWLPVLKPNNQLQGIVDRSRLVASLILDVTTQLAATAPDR